MTNTKRILFYFAVSLLVLAVHESQAAGTAKPGPRQQDAMIGQVYAAMQKEQVQHSQPFRPFPMQWREDRGLYRSSIHLDFVGQGCPPPQAVPGSRISFRSHGFFILRGAHFYYFSIRAQHSSKESGPGRVVG